MQPVSVTGPETFDAQARMFPMQCLQAADAGSLWLMYEGDPDFRMVLTVDLPSTAVGSHPLTGKDLRGVIVGRNPAGIVDLFRSLVQSGSSSEEVPGWAHGLSIGDDSAPAGTVTLRAATR